VNTASLNDVEPFAHYGVERKFTLRRLPCLDLLPLVPGQSNVVAKVFFLLQIITFTLSAVFATLFTTADIFYSRDVIPLLALSVIKPRRSLAYEAHSAAGGRVGRLLQGLVLRRVGHVISTTARLRDTLVERGASTTAVFAAHDGIRRARFEALPSRESARMQLGLPASAHIVSYVGRLQTLDMDKGVGHLVEALASFKWADACLLLVGGPDEQAQALRARWEALGGDVERFLYVGQVTPDRVPLYMVASDVCAMPFPWTEHFAYYASPIKLFEYMAAGRAIVASDLPSTQEVVRDGETALLYATGDTVALAAALSRLYHDAELRERLGAAARELALGHYTWDARARTILQRLQSSI
jgi:glycosyltransferase involved in cell wall biosynthesis